MLKRTNLAILLLFTAGGCEHILAPSTRERLAATLRHQSHFQADRATALRQTFFLFSVDAIVPDPVFDPETRHFVFDTDERLSQGLAVAVAADGYFLTAAHVLGESNFVMGYFDGKLCVKRARIVLQPDRREGPDIAILKMEGAPDQSVVIGPAPEAGDVVFAVIREAEDSAPGGRLHLAGGKVRERFSDPEDSRFTLLDSDIPTWHGDSGGPLYSSAGTLVGIVTGYVCRWYGVYWHCQRISCLPSRQFVEEAIKRDRTARVGCHSLVHSPTCGIRHGQPEHSARCECAKCGTESAS